MVEMFNVLEIQEFDDFLTDFINCSIFAYDTETNGLWVNKGNHPISLSFYFPEFDRGYNVPFYHGVGQVIYDDSVDDASFHRRSWQGNTKRQIWKAFWYPKFKEDRGRDWYENLPEEYLDMLRDTWNKMIDTKTVLMYNASFDVHMSEAIGLKSPSHFEDVMSAVSLYFEDWSHPDLVDGKKPLRGNRQLKWQCDFWQIPGANAGLDSFDANTEFFELEWAQFILDHWDEELDQECICGGKGFFEYENTEVEPIGSEWFKVECDRCGGTGIKRGINSTFYPASMNKKTPPTTEEIAKKLKLSKGEMWMMPSSATAQYAIMDVVLTYRLREHLIPKLKEWRVYDLYNDQNAAHANLVIRMERNGFLLDDNVALATIDELAQENDKLAWEFEEEAQRLQDESEEDLELLPFKVNSPKKMIKFLNLQGIDVDSTARSVLEEWDDDNIEDGEEVDSTWLQKLIDFRHNHRAMKTYLTKWIEAQDADGYIHPGFNINGTTTGRWSSSSGPLGNSGNFQNIPTRGFSIKKAIIVPDGWWLVQGDYSQIELRLASWIADCQPMIKAFNQGVDLHQNTAELLDVRENLFPRYKYDDWAVLEVVGTKGNPQNDEEAAYEVKDWARKVAKVLNFGLLYNAGPGVPAKMLRIDIDTAYELYSLWHRAYPEYKEANRYYEALALEHRCRPDGLGKRVFQYVQQPISGRTRKFMYYSLKPKTVRDKNDEPYTYIPRQYEASKAFNAVVQGLANYFLWQSSNRIAYQIDNGIYRPVAHIHDSLNFYLKKGYEPILCDMYQTMVDWDTNPKQHVEFEVSDTNWQDTRSIDIETEWWRE